MTSLTIELRGGAALQAALQALENEFAERVLRASLSAAILAIEGWVKQNIQAQGLIDTGNLINSWQVVVEVNGSTGEATCYSNVEYARIHEYGGVIVPVNGEFLHWVNDAGEDIFARSVTIPARPYARPALDQHVDDIERIFADAAWRAIRQVTGGGA